MRRIYLQVACYSRYTTQSTSDIIISQKTSVSSAMRSSLCFDLTYPQGTMTAHRRMRYWMVTVFKLVTSAIGRHLRGRINRLVCLNDRNNESNAKDGSAAGAR